MKRWVLWTSVAGLLAGGPAHADSAIDRSYGTPNFGLSARARAMGGAGSALNQGAYSLVDNPAGMALADMSRVDLSLNVERHSEIRFVPLFDTFDSYVDDTAIAVNDNQYAALMGGVAWKAEWARGLVLGLGMFDRYDPRYDYFDERRTTATSDQLLATRTITTDGVLRMFSAGAGVSFNPGTAFGLGVNWYSGDFKDRDATVPHASTTPGVVTELERRLSGVSLTWGATARLNERLDLALAFESGPRLHNDYTQTQDGVVVSADDASTELDLPMRVQGGAAFRPRNTQRTTFAMDVIWMPWSDVDDGLAPDQELEDTWDVRFGLEHIYYNTLPGRLGFRYTRSYMTREADRAFFTFGIGYKVQHLELDFGGEIGKRTSRQEPVWPRDEQGPAVGAGEDRVEDTTARMTLGIQTRF